MSVPNDLMFSPDGIADALLSLPKELLQSDLDIAKAEQELAEQDESLDIAIVNASINADQSGKNAEARELARKQAIANDASVKVAQMAVAAIKVIIEQMRAQNKTLSRQFAAMCHIAELRAAQMLLMSKGVTK